MRKFSSLISLQHKHVFLNDKFNNSYFRQVNSSRLPYISERQIRLNLIT